MSGHEDLRTVLTNRAAAIDAYIASLPGKVDAARAVIASYPDDLERAERDRAEVLQALAALYGPPAGVTPRDITPGVLELNVAGLTLSPGAEPTIEDARLYAAVMRTLYQEATTQARQAADLVRRLEHRQQQADTETTALEVIPAAPAPAEGPPEWPQRPADPAPEDPAGAQPVMAVATCGGCGQPISRFGTEPWRHKDGLRECDIPGGTLAEPYVPADPAVTLPDTTDDAAEDGTAQLSAVDPAEPAPDHSPAVPLAPNAGSAIPGQPGYVVGKCGHRVAQRDWRAGYRVCERCPYPADQNVTVDDATGGA